jgi:diguanylate cyclase (GGDEF)-like protein
MMTPVPTIALPKLNATSDRRKQAPELSRADPDNSPATRLATARQKGRALWTGGAVALITAVFVPMAGAQWPRISAFLPAYQTTVIIAYVITAYLIFAHFRATRSLALLCLSGGCLYTGAILVAQFLTVPGMFLPQGPLFGGAQATIWLWCLWHVGPSAGIFLYVVSEWLWPNFVVDDPKRAARWLGAVLVVLFGASIAAITIFHDFLPVLDIDGNFHRITTTGVAPAIQVLSATALLLLWRATGFRTVLQVWLGVAVFALLCDNTITMLGGNRLSVGWYVGRLNALISATTIMLVYLAEINRSYLKSVVDAKQLATSYARLEIKADEARIDHLTGLAGRALFLEQAEALRSHSAADNLATAVLFIDLDGFKAINDKFGHDRGDTVLAQAAQVLRSSLRDTDIAGRLGGDEFVVCLVAPSEFIEKTATAIAGRILAKIPEIGNGVGCSVGISLSNGELVDVETAIRQADEAMYAAKKHGKNRFVIHGRPRLAAVA